MEQEVQGVAIEAQAALVPTAYRFVDPYVIVASSASAVSARLFTHPRASFLGSLSELGRGTPSGIELIETQVLSSPREFVLFALGAVVDTMRIKVQTYPGSVVPPFRELFPKPRLRPLYAGTNLCSFSRVHQFMARSSRFFLCVTGLPVAIAFSIPALSIYLTTYEGAALPLINFLDAILTPYTFLKPSLKTLPRPPLPPRRPNPLSPPTSPRLYPRRSDGRRCFSFLSRFPFIGPPFERH